MKKVLLILANGCEELEAVTVLDILRRAGIHAVAAGLEVGHKPVVCSRQTVLVPDVGLDEALSQDFHMLVLPGGQPGTDNLGRDRRVVDLVCDMVRQGKYVAAICAAPMVLAAAGVLTGHRATSYPGCLEGMGLSDVHIDSDLVVQDKNIITAKGPGAAMDFALKLVEILTDKPTRDRIERDLQRR